MELVASLLRSFLLYNEIVIYTGKMKAQQLALFLGPTLSWKQLKQSMHAAWKQFLWFWTETHLNRSNAITVATIPMRERTTPTIVSTSSILLSTPDGLHSWNLEQISYIEMRSSIPQNLYHHNLWQFSPLLHVGIGRNKCRISKKAYILYTHSAQQILQLLCIEV